MTHPDDGLGPMVFVISAGLVTLLLALCLPIQVRPPGDHETVGCGNTLVLDPPGSPEYPPDEAAESTRDRCVTQRNQRLVLSGVVVLAPPRP